MGGSINSSIATKMKEAQKEAQSAMAEMQKNNMVKSQDRMLRVQMATQMAFSRDIFLWMGGVWVTLVAGTVVRVAVTRKPPPPALIGPIFGLGIGAAYQYDMGYGNKINRIEKARQDILNDPNYWFNPINSVFDEEKMETKEK